MILQVEAVVSKDIQYLTVLSQCRIQGKTRTYAGYECKCICGNLKKVLKHDFNRNFVTSCGCKTGILISNRHIKLIDLGTSLGLLTVIDKTDIKSTEGYKYVCKCICGNTIEVYANRLKRGETKSCGCSSIKLNSLNNGGTGTPRENLSLQEALRSCDDYIKFVKYCLARAEGKSELSGITGEVLHVHHLDSVSYLIKTHELTMKTYLGCTKLFDPTNAIVITGTEHRAFHKEYGHITTASDWESFTNVIKLY
jgi:hypothetical protein